MLLCYHASANKVLASISGVCRQILDMQMRMEISSQQLASPARLCRIFGMETRMRIALLVSAINAHEGVNSWSQARSYSSRRGQAADRRLHAPELAHVRGLRPAQAFRRAQAVDVDQGADKMTEDCRYVEVKKGLLPAGRQDQVARGFRTERRPSPVRMLPLRRAAA